MYILGLDTTQAACSAAVFDTSSGRICARVWEKMPRGHAEALPAIIAQTLDQAELSFADITKLATSVGPGTFTGVRVGLSAARGFALALDLPLVGVTSLEAIAAGEPFLPLLMPGAMRFMYSFLTRVNPASHLNCLMWSQQLFLPVTSLPMTGRLKWLVPPAHYWLNETALLL